MIELDVAIVGGGVLGVLVLRLLRRAGYEAFLFEKDRLGEGQTLHSQAYLIDGHLYAPATASIAGLVPAVDGRRFRRGAHAWRVIARTLRVRRTEGAYHVPSPSALGTTRLRWEAAGLDVQKVTTPDGLVTTSDVFRSNESFFEDGRALMEALVDDHAQWIRRAEVVRTDAATGEIDLVIAGQTHRARARRIVVAGIGKGPRVANPGLTFGPRPVQALVAIGRGLPRFALTFAPARGAVEPTQMMGVPRVPTGATEHDETAFLMSGLRGRTPGPWARAWAVAATTVLPALRGARFGYYPEPDWPAFVMPDSFQCEDEGQLIGARPVRLTLAPLAAFEIAGRIHRALRKPRAQRVPVPGPAHSDVAPERWQNCSTYPLTQLP